jgi:uracil-DNA glycosylase family 4
MQDNFQYRQALSEVSEDIGACEACELRAYGSTPIPGYGLPIAKLFIIGIAPTVSSEHARRPFTGDPGFRLDCWLEYAGLTRSDTYVTNAIKCVARTPQGKPLGSSFFFNDSWWHSCRQWLKKEFSCVGASIVVLLGKQTVQWLRGYDSVARFQREKQGVEYRGKYWFALNHPSFSSRRGEWIRDMATRETADKIRELVSALRQGLE